MQQVELPDRRIVLQLAGVLRLANALDTRNGHKPHLEVSVADKTVLVQAPEYSALERSAENVAAARHLLEIVLRRPVLVRRLRTSGPQLTARTA
jgi:hypothetical protein